MKRQKRWLIGPIGPIGPMGPMGLIGLIGFMSLLGCKQPTPEELATLAAKGYYTHLAAGEYEHFLEGKAGADSLPADYREQLLVGCKQFLVQQKERHQGIVAVSAPRAQMDSTLQQMQVFLILQYADSTQEEIVVPMVEHNGRWQMK